MVLFSLNISPFLIKFKLLFLDFSPKVAKTWR